VYCYYTYGNRFKYLGKQDINSNVSTEFLGFYENDELNIDNALSDYVVYKQDNELFIMSLEDYKIGFFVNMGTPLTVDEYITIHEDSDYWGYDSETMDSTFQNYALDQIIDNLINSSKTSNLDEKTYKIVVNEEGEISLEITKD
jgi:hypothetical protein